MTILDPPPFAGVAGYELTTPFVHHPAELDRRGVALPADCPSVSVIIPVKNEAANLPWVFERLPLGISEVIVVDGKSTDDTLDVVRALRPDAVIVQQTRKGKGNAMACGFAAARGDIFVMLDADGSAHPAEIVDFVAALTAGADFAKGSRFTAGGGSADITRVRRAGNAVLSKLVNAMCKTTFSDLCYGYNAFWRHCLPYFELPPTSGDEPQQGDGFEIETLINVRTAQSPLSITEVASFESCRLHGASNLHPVRDGLRVLRVIVREWSSTRRSGKTQTPSLPALAQLVPAPAYPDEIHPSVLTRNLADSEEVA